DPRRGRRGGQTGDGERSLGSSVGGAAPVEHPTEVDAAADFRRPNDRLATDCADAARSRSCGLSFEKESPCSLASLTPPPTTGRPSSWPGWRSPSSAASPPPRYRSAGSSRY